VPRRHRIGLAAGLLAATGLVCIGATLKHVANITVTMSPELIREAKILAVRRDTSVSGLLAELLRSAMGQADDYRAVWDEEKAAMEAGLLEVGGITWTRDEVHAR